jgi:tripartite-type tricarboxylate transporter receptor subunit TctC
MRAKADTENEMRHATTTLNRRSALKTIVTGVAAASALGPPQAFGQAWPDRTIRAISPITAGSAADAVTRTVLEQVSSQIGQPIVVENRPGGDGTIGSAAVARAAPDGYTILSHSAAQTVVATTHTGLSYDTYSDFARVAPMAKIPSVLVIGAQKNIHSVADLVAAARNKPFNFASPGAFTHLNTERFLRSADFTAQRIPFKGAPEALTEIVAGRVDFYFSPIFVALPLITVGTLIPLAVTGNSRTPLLPSVPTFAEIGFPNADDNFWIGLFVPAHTPRAIIERLNQETTAALKTPAVIEKLAKFGAEPISATPDQFDAMVKAQIAANAELIKTAGISVN